MSGKVDIETVYQLLGLVAADVREHRRRKTANATLLFGDTKKSEQNLLG